tara:strand:+ start:112 stop:501 length:390 start_codon:yes stop_codon:yes gene_type:complete
MDYKRTDIREHFEEWIMQRVHNGDEVIKNYKVIDEEKDGEEYMKVLNYIMDGAFVDNIEYEMSRDKAVAFIGDAHQEMFDYVGENLATGTSDHKQMEESPEFLVFNYAMALGEEIVEEWMNNPKFSFEH